MRAPLRRPARIESAWMGARAFPPQGAVRRPRRSRKNHARPPRWRLGDAPKRMPCAFLCSLVNPSPAFSMTRPEPLPWWARGTAPVRRGNERIRRFFPFGGESERQEERSAPVVVAHGEGTDRWRSRNEYTSHGLGGRGVMTELDRIIERHPWVALLIMALCCFMVCTADGWW